MNASIALFAALLAMPGLTAQAQSAVRSAPTRTPIHTTDDHMGIPYGTWGAGADYKASFHDGMTFVPYLGSEYPNNQPWSWQTRSVRWGENELLATGELATNQQTDFRFEYRFGAVVEAYDIRAEGLEQTFVFDRPHGSGDLIIRGEFTSALTTNKVNAAHQELVFVDGSGHEILSYGKAFVFDAAGNRTAITTACDGHSITLRVPATWLDGAVYPIVVDPLIAGSVFTPWGGNGFKRLDAASHNDASQNNTMFIGHRAASAAEDDVFAWTCDSSGLNQFLIYSDITTAWDSDDPSCAYVDDWDKWAMVLRRYVYSGPSRTSQIRAHLHTLGWQTFSPTTIGLQRAPNGNDWRPDIGGAASGNNGDHAMVVLQREDNTSSSGNWANTGASEIVSVPLDCSTALGTFGTVRSVSDNLFNNPDAERPSITQSITGDDLRWMCAFQQRAHSAADWDIKVRSINEYGIVSFTAWLSQLAPDDSLHQLAPVIAGADGRYAVAYATVDVASAPATTSPYGKDVRVERFDWSPSASGPQSTEPPAQLDSDTSRTFEVGGIAIDHETESHFAIGWRRLFSSTGSVNGAWGARVGYTGNLTEGPFMLHVLPGEQTSAPTVAFNSWTDEHFLFCYGTTGGPSGNMLTWRHLEYAAAVPWSNAGTACTNGLLTWNGDQLIGSEFNSVQSHGAPLSSLHFLAVSLAPVNVPINLPGVGAGCRVLIDPTVNFIGIMPAVLGSFAYWRFPLPEFLPSTSLHFQDWILTGSQFESTRRLTVPIVK